MQEAPAPEWKVARWFNTPAPLTLASLRGRVVFMVAFQMLCPGCVSEGLPQAQRVREAFPESELAVIGLHTVFEHHEAQGTEAALAAFLHEYRIGFPVGIDESDIENGIPRTMQAYGMRGTPTMLIFDRIGRLCVQQFGHLDDLRLGAVIATLIAEERQSAGAEPVTLADAGQRCPAADGTCG
jgi:hypothetical protein